MLRASCGHDRGHLTIDRGQSSVVVTQIALTEAIANGRVESMRTRTFFLGASLTLATVATIVACTGDSSTTDSSAAKDAGHADASQQQTVDGSGGGSDAGMQPTDSGKTGDTGVDSGPLPPPLPSALGGRLVLWLSADKDFSTDGGFAVWKDQSGTGNDALQALSASIPALFDGGTGVGGKPALHFSGAEYLQIADTASLQWAASDFSLFMVERHTNDPSVYAILYTKWTDDGAQGFPGFFLWADYPTSSGIVARLDTQNVVFGPDGGNDGIARVVGARKNGSDLQLYSGGKLVGEMPDASVANPAEFNAPTIPAYIGGRPQGIQMLQGDVAEVIGVKGTLTDKELADLHAYLKAKYNL